MSEERARVSDVGTGVAALAEAWPRALIAEGAAQALAAWWVESRRAAVQQGYPDLARIPLSKGMSDALFEIRRARRLVRGLEGAGAKLEALDLGVRQASSRRQALDSAEGPAPRRISRLLMLSADASPRFYRQVEHLVERHASRLETLVLDCDENAFGAALFGAGQRVRAALVDHKDAVTRILRVVVADAGLETPSADLSNE